MSREIEDYVAVDDENYSLKPSRIVTQKMIGLFRVSDGYNKI